MCFPSSPSASGGAKEQNVLTVYDVQNQFIGTYVLALSAVFPVLMNF